MNTDSIEKQILLRAPLTRVWRALTDSKEFGTWFGMHFDAPFEPGATLTAIIRPSNYGAEAAEIQKKHEGLTFQVTIDRIEPMRLFSYRWHPNAIDPAIDYSAEPTTLVTFALEEQPDGVLLTLTESGFDSLPESRRAQALASNTQGWSLVVGLLEAYLVPAT